MKRFFQRVIWVVAASAKGMIELVMMEQKVNNKKL